MGIDGMRGSIVLIVDVAGKMELTIFRNRVNQGEGERTCSSILVCGMPPT